MNNSTTAPLSLWQCGVDRFLAGCKMSEATNLAQIIEAEEVTARVYALDRLPKYSQQELAKYFPRSWRNGFEKASTKRQALMCHAMSYLLLKCEEMFITPKEATLSNRCLHMHGFWVDTTANTSYEISTDILFGDRLSEAYLDQSGDVPAIVELQVGKRSRWLRDLAARTVYVQGNGRSALVYNEPVDRKRTVRSTAFLWRKEDSDGIQQSMTHKLIPLQGIVLMAQAFTVDRIWLSDTELATMTPSAKFDALAAGLKLPTISANAGNKHKADIFVEHILMWDSLRRNS